MDNKPRVPLIISWSSYIVISMVVFIMASLNIALWVWILEGLFKGQPPMPLEIQSVFATILTAITMMKNFRIEEGK